MLLRNTSRNIKKSLGRYFSLLIIILLGVGFYTGVKVSIPNIQDTQKKYYDETSLADIKLISEIGFNDADIKEPKLTGVAKGEGSYSKDIIIDEKVIKLHSITEKVNGYQLIKKAVLQKYDPNANQIDCCNNNFYYKLDCKNF